MTPTGDLIYAELRDHILGEQIMKSQKLWSTGHFTVSPLQGTDIN